MTWIDISVPIRPGMVTFEGDPAVSMRRVADMAAGAICNLSAVACGSHTGTHIDAPAHFIPGAPAVDAIPLDALVGPVFVADATGRTAHLDAAAVAALRIPPGTERLILKTDNSRLWDDARFRSDFIGLTGDGAAALVALGVRLVGIDYLSIAPYDDPAPAHIALLAAGIVIVEGLDLRAVPPGHYELACLPLRLESADGAPARALLREVPTGDRPTGAQP
ncbi:MAG: cyclase family protein [Dehalococcoidia bacterium]|nr:cyclase family protein [Dehalococcoidia bacterium]